MNNLNKLVFLVLVTLNFPVFCTIGTKNVRLFCQWYVCWRFYKLTFAVLLFVQKIMDDIKSKKELNKWKYMKQQFSELCFDIEICINLNSAQFSI